MGIRIITLDEIKKAKKDKEKELGFYLEKKRQLEFRLNLIRTDIRLTDQIIKMIENEQ